jgi:lycopene beta-cyclase
LQNFYKILNSIKIYNFIRVLYFCLTYFLKSLNKINYFLVLVIMENQSFDITFLGAGCASYQLMHQLASQSNWLNQEIALFTDGALHHRSWCFWSAEKHPLQHLVKKSWSKVAFVGRDFTKIENIAPYQYHYIAGADFFNFFKTSFLPQNPHVKVVETLISSVKKRGNEFSIHNGTKKWASKTVFNSLPPTSDKIETPNALKQHFKGWFIRTEMPVFDETTMTLMDFSIPQEDGVRFVYTLPFSKTEALIEMTAFSKNIYPEAIYDAILETYMNEHFKGVTFSVENIEKGSIPMTDALFSRVGSAGETLVGTAAGMVKATTGYAFKRIGKDSTQIAEDFEQKRTLRWANTKGRFRFYDRLLLGILSEKPSLGRTIFEALFKKTPMKTVLRFLDEETSILEEIKIFSTLPIFPFIRQIFKTYHP